MSTTATKTWRRRYRRIARFDGSCRVCGEKIERGTPIGWKPGMAASHWDCYMGLHDVKESVEPRVSWESRYFAGSGGRGPSDRARKDQEAVKRAKEKIASEHGS